MCRTGGPPRRTRHGGRVGGYGRGTVDDLNTVLIVAAGLVLAAVLASKLSARLGVPALLLFLGIGMLAGSDGLGGLEFDDNRLAQSVGIVALVLILFAGGLDTHWTSVRPVAGRGLVLATVGVLTTAGVSGAIAVWVLELPLTTGLLLGAIMSSTDAAAVFSVLRSRNVSLRGNLRPLLELESGSNDPMAVFLTIGLVELVSDPGRSAWSLVPLFVVQMVVGAAVGVAAGRALVALLNRLRLEYEGLYPVVTLAAVVLTYGTTAALSGSGFLAVYLLGLGMARHEFAHRRSLVRFHGAVAWLAQIGMFLALGLLVEPSDLPALAGQSLLVAAGLALVARPLGVFVSLVRSSMSWRARTMVAWVGLRGAAPIILATYPLLEGIPEADTIFDVVFFVVLTSVLVQGTTIPTVARWLHVDEPLPVRPPWPLEPGLVAEGDAALHELRVAPGAPAVGRSIMQLGVPAGTIIVLVQRSGSFIVPEGSSHLQEGDELLAIGDPDGIEVLRALVDPASRAAD